MRSGYDVPDVRFSGAVRTVGEMNRIQRTKPVLGVVLAAALSLTACGGDDGEDSQSKEKKTGEESSQTEGDGQAGQAPEPDLEGIPDVVAEVNGEEVSKDEFVTTYEMQYQQASMQAQMSGEAPDEDALKKQAADYLVDTKLLTQEAASRDIETSDKDVDAELTELAKQNQAGSVKELLAGLEEQGTSEEVVRAQLATQVTVERLVADEIGDVEPSDKELRETYDAAVKQQKQAGKQGGQQQQQIPPFAEVKEQLAEQATAEKQNQAAQEMVAELRKGADITVNL